MAYKRKYATKAELSAALSRAARSRKNIHNCGRKRTTPGEKVKTSSLYVRQDDRNVFATVAAHNGQSMVEFMHYLAEGIRARRPDIF